MYFFVGGFVVRDRTQTGKKGKREETTSYISEYRLTVYIFHIPRVFIILTNG
jgi:hypothetical protein